MYEALRKVCLLCGYEAVRCKRKRERLSRRLHRMFFMDALEGQLDCLVRSMAR